MPRSAILATCGLLVGAACLMASASVALAADGSFQLVRVLATEDVWGLDERILGAWAHQVAVVIALRAGVTDTQILSMLLGVGHFLVPAVAWSIAIVLARADRLVCIAVAMIAGLSSGATWFISVNEVVLAAPLTIVVAVLLWLPRAWRWHDVVLAVAACGVLVACYETAALTGSVLAFWAAWRAIRDASLPERLGCAAVAALSVISVAVAIVGTRAGANPDHSQGFLYNIVSLEPWPFYVALAGIAAFVGALGPWLVGAAQSVTLAFGSLALIVAVVGSEPNTLTGIQARGGVAVAALVLEVFLLWRWVKERPGQMDERLVRRPRGNRVLEGVLAAVPVLFVASMIAVNLQPLRNWARSLDAFRAEVDRSEGVVEAVSVLPEDRRAVLWGWTSSSLSLLVRGNPEAGILVDRYPSFVPFPPHTAREQLLDVYTWRS